MVRRAAARLLTLVRGLGSCRTAGAALLATLFGLVGLLGLTACSGSSSSPSEPATQSSGAGPTTSAPDSTTAAAGPTPYLPVPKGTVLTDPGSELELGESAVVAWHPRKGEVGVLKVTVRRFVHADIKALADWQLDTAGRASSLYYVTVAVSNAGDTELGGRTIPLYLLDGRNTLVEPNAFKSTFAPCPSEPLPASFGPGDKARACLVYLVPQHGTLVNATFRPFEHFNPITWVGRVIEPKPAKRPTKKASRG
ncbi:MAG: hypothetical protein QOJ68_388 [Blastococcus sp.]|nr:hypothetical protein [Blastococcus sp.]